MATAVLDGQVYTQNSENMTSDGKIDPDAVAKVGMPWLCVLTEHRTLADAAAATGVPLPRRTGPVRVDLGIRPSVPFVHSCSRMAAADLSTSVRPAHEKW